MKKVFKKLFVSLMMMALVLSTMTVPSVEVKADGETTAYLSFADSEWKVQYWFDGNDYAPIKATNATVNGFGQYTVALDFTGVEGGVAPNIEFFDVEVKDGETLYPNSYMTIDSVKINGEAVELGKTYTSTDDKINTRTNLYNKWVSEVTEGRTADGNGDGCSPAPIAGDKYTNIKTVEVTFTLGDGVVFGAQTIAATEAKPLPAEGTTTYISMADSNWTYQYWFDGKDYAPVVANNAMVTGVGQYTVSLDFSGVEGGVCPNIEFMDVEIDDGELYFPNCYMQIDSVKINGEAVTLGKTYTSSDNKEDTRTNLYNKWVSEVTEGRSADGNISDVTPTPVAGDTVTNIKTVEVTYTLVEGKASEAPQEEYVIPTEFNAFMMFADGTGVWENYNPGVAGDAKILGDGKWEVVTTAAQLGATAQAAPDPEKLVFLVDIEGLGDAMKAVGTLREAADGSFTDTDAKATVEVYVDGVKVNSKNKNILMGDLEGNGRFRLELYNAYGSGTKDNPVVMPETMTPNSEVKVVFTLEGTGFNTGAVIEEPTQATTVATTEATTAATTEATTQAADTTDEGGPSTMIIVIVIIAIAAAGCAAYVVMQKNKKK